MHFKTKKTASSFFFKNPDAKYKFFYLASVYM